MIRHKFRSLKADDPAALTDGQVLPSHWNEEHEIGYTAHQLSGNFVQIPAADHKATWPAITVRVFRPDGVEVEIMSFSTPLDVTIESNVDLSGHIALIY